MRSHGFSSRPYQYEFSNYFRDEANVIYVVTALEVCCKVVGLYKSSNTHNTRLAQAADAVLFAVNHLLRLHGLGYQYLNGQIIKVSSGYVHSEAVAPVLALIRYPEYVGVEAEFLGAHYHFMQGHFAECLNECLKAFESTMKVICNRRGWSVAANATASTLIKACFDNELVPSFWQGQFSALQSMLGSSIPTARNRMSGHGQGIEERDIPEYLAAYMLHMTASTILFLVEADKYLG